MESQIIIRIEEDKKEELLAEAQKRGLNLSGYCRMILYDFLAEFKKTSGKSEI